MLGGLLGAPGFGPEDASRAWSGASRRTCSSDFSPGLQADPKGPRRNHMFYVYLYIHRHLYSDRCIYIYIHIYIHRHLYSDPEGESLRSFHRSCEECICCCQPSIFLLALKPEGLGSYMRTVRGARTLPLHTRRRVADVYA